MSSIEIVEKDGQYFYLDLDGISKQEAVNDSLGNHEAGG